MSDGGVQALLTWWLQKVGLTSDGGARVLLTWALQTFGLTPDGGVLVLPTFVRSLPYELNGGAQSLLTWALQMLVGLTPCGCLVAQYLRARMPTPELWVAALPLQASMACEATAALPFLQALSIPLTFQRVFWFLPDRMAKCSLLLHGSSNLYISSLCLCNP